MSKLARIIKDNIYKDYAPQELIQENVIQFKGWKCSAGTEGLFIDWSGEVWPATCVVQSRRHRLGSIYDESPIELLDSYITCQAKTCPCLVEIYLPKYKINPTSLVESAPGDVSLSDFDAISRASDHDRDRKYIMWAFGRKCNFSCSYCDDHSHSKDDNDLVTKKAIEKVTEYSDKFRQGKSLMWSFTGGEPTINPLFFDFVKLLHSKGDTITVASNGSQHASYYAELSQYANINISVHFEYLKPSKLSKIVSTVIQNQLMWFGLNFMIMPGKIDKCIEYIAELKKIPNFKEKTNVHFDILRVKNTGIFEIYSAEELEMIKKLQSGDYD